MVHTPYPNAILHWRCQLAGGRQYVAVSNNQLTHLVVSVQHYTTVRPRGRSQSTYGFDGYCAAKVDAPENT